MLHAFRITPPGIAGGKGEEIVGGSVSKGVCGVNHNCPRQDTRRFFAAQGEMPSSSRAWLSKQSESGHWEERVLLK